MDINNFKRLNLLSEKVLCENATTTDLYEFIALLNQWKTSDDLKEFGNLYIPSPQGYNDNKVLNET